MNYSIEIDDAGRRNDPDCVCDEQPEAMRHGRVIRISLTMLHFLAQEARCNLVFLPDGRVWVGNGSASIHNLADQLEDEKNSTADINALVAASEG